MWLATLATLATFIGDVGDVGDVRRRSASERLQETFNLAEAGICVNWSGRTVLRTADTCHNLQTSKVITPMSRKVVLDHELIPAGSHNGLPTTFKKNQEKKGKVEQ